MAFELVAFVLSTVLLVALSGLSGLPVAFGTWAGLVLVVAAAIGIGIGRRRRRSA